jgi:hypothetical protein
MSQPTYHYCGAGKLVTKDKAPKCQSCGVSLWKAISWSYSYSSSVPQRDGKGRRLGYVPTSRGTGKTYLCWNGKACAARNAKRSPLPLPTEGQSK